MYAPSLLKQLLNEVACGDDSPRVSSGRQRSVPGKVLIQEEGTIPLVTVVAVVFFMLLFGFIGNTGKVVKEKLEIQNASDAVAYSSALWMARGMNAITATNHLLGEATAICVVHEAIGGPELDALQSPPQPGTGKLSPEFTEMNTLLNGLKGAALLRGPAQPYDEIVTGEMVKALVKDQGNASSGAAVFDAQGTLKWVGDTLLVIKVLGNVGIASGIFAGLGMGLHILAAPFQVKVTMEAHFLKGLEYIAWGMRQAKFVIEDQIIPAMAKYPKTLVESSIPLTGGMGNLIGLSVSQTVKGIGKANNVDQSIFPTPLMIELPVQPEPALKTRSFAQEPTPLSARSPLYDTTFGKALTQFNDLRRKVDSYIGRLTRGVSSVLGVIPGAKGLLDKIEGPWANFQRSLQSFASPPPELGYDFNPSRDLFQSQLKGDWDQIKSSQWVRATFPWVDAYRAPIRGFTGSFAVLALSDFGKYFVLWSNRYTLSKVFQYRQGRISHSGSRIEPLSIYIMQEMTPLEKGYENWTTDSRKAETMFTFVGFARRPQKTLMSPVVYKQIQPSEFVTFSQAMVYNANPQQPILKGSFGRYQPEIGWDTLNWEGRAKEWGARENTGTGGGSPLEIAQLFQFLDSADPPQIKLNWQAKLVPVTRTRMKDAVPANLVKPEFRRALLPWIDPAGFDPSTLTHH